MMVSIKIRSCLATKTPVIGLTQISSNSILRLFVIKPDRKSPITSNIVCAMVGPHLDVGCLLAVTFDASSLSATVSSHISG